MELTAEEIRVVASLVEKQFTTPQQYPLTLGALTAACNQSTNREPVVAYDESTVREALTGLSGHELARSVYPPGSRTAKYRHLLDEYFDLDVAQVAVLCVLLLRGPQTTGELRLRTERIHHFDSLAAVEEVLHALATHPYQALVAELPRRPGQSQTRYTHLLSSAAVDPVDMVVAAGRREDAGELQAAGELEGQVQRLAAELEELRDRLAAVERRLGPEA